MTMAQSGKYVVEYDLQRGLLRYRISGFWTLADVDAFKADLVREIKRFSTGDARPLVLADASQFAVQSAPVAKAIETLMFGDVMPRIGRIALIVATMLNKLQVERAGLSDQMSIFLHEADAIAWLTSKK
jgi:hypothetical protein